MGGALYQSATGLSVNSMISNYTYLQWVLHIGLDLTKVCNNKQQVHYAHSGDLLVPCGLL